MKINALAPWAGSKRQFAHIIAELAGKRRMWYEMFAGGVSLIWAQPICDVEMLCDLNDEIITVAHTLQNRPNEVLLLLRDMSFSRETFDLAVANKTNMHDTASWTANRLAAWWMGLNGLAGTEEKPVFGTRKTKTGGSPITRWNSFRESLPEMIERMKHCAFLHRDFRNTELPDEKGVVIYADPPYVRKSFRYLKDFSYMDHHLLADKLNKIQRSKVIVSYGDDPLVDKLYKGWQKITLPASNSMAHSLGKTSNAVEILLVRN